jgi:hypothetical protein
MKLMPWKKGGTVSGDKGDEPAPVHADAHHPVVADHAHAQPVAHAPEVHSTPTDHAQEAAQAAVIAEMKSQSDAIKDLTKKMQEQENIISSTFFAAYDAI